MPRVAYLGDSSPGGSTPARQCSAEVLIMELTFVAPGHRKDKIHKFGHMHLDDFLDRRERFKNELIIASHFSTRYHPGQIRQHVERRCRICWGDGCNSGFEGGKSMIEKVEVMSLLLQACPSFARLGKSITSRSTVQGMSSYST